MIATVTSSTTTAAPSPVTLKNLQGAKYLTEITAPKYNIACKNFIISPVIINRYGFVRFWEGMKELECIFYVLSLSNENFEA